MYHFYFCKGHGSNLISFELTDSWYIFVWNFYVRAPVTEPSERSNYKCSNVYSQHLKVRL